MQVLAVRLFTGLWEWTFLTKNIFGFAFSFSERLPLSINFKTLQNKVILPVHAVISKSHEYSEFEQEPSSSNTSKWENRVFCVRKKNELKSGVRLTCMYYMMMISVDTIRASVLVFLIWFCRLENQSNTSIYFDVIITWHLAVSAPI